MARRPFLKFYPGDWRGNTKLRGASLQDRAAWLEVLCLLHDSDEYGVLRWELKKIAATIPVHVNLLHSLRDQRILKGADAGEQFEGLTHVDRNGASHTLIAPCPGPVWFSSRMVLDNHLEQIAQRSGKRGGNPTLKGALNPHPKPQKPEARSQRTPNGVQGGGAATGGEADHVRDAAEKVGGRGLDGMPPIPRELDVEPFRVAWADWQQHRREIRKKLTPMAVSKAFRELAPLGPARAVAAINHSIANGWTGIFEPDAQRKGSHGSQHPRHTPNRPGEFSRPLPSAKRTLDADIAAVKAEEAAGAAGGGVGGAADPRVPDPLARAAG